MKSGCLVRSQHILWRGHGKLLTVEKVNSSVRESASGRGRHSPLDTDRNYYGSREPLPIFQEVFRVLAQVKGCHAMASQIECRSNHCVGVSLESHVVEY